MTLGTVYAAAKKGPGIRSRQGSCRLGTERGWPMSKETPMLFSSLQRLEELEEGTRAAPKESELCLTLGEALLRVNRVDEAAASYQRAVELDPRSDLRALYWEWLGLVREMEGRLEEALEAYFHWLDADPVAMSPLDRLASLLVILGRWTDLRLLKPQYIRRSEVAPSARTRESLALYTFVTEQLGESSTETKEVAMTALEADPDSPALRFLLGLLTFQEGALELSRGEFERVLDLDADGMWQEHRFALDWNGAKARVMVAKLARLQGDQETALAMLANLEEIDRSDSEGLTEAAELMLENGRYEELVSLLSDLPSGPSKVDRLRAEGLLGQGLWGPARDIFETEKALLDEPEASSVEFASSELGSRLEALWEKARGAEELGEEIAALRREAPQAWEDEPLGACLMLLHRARQGALSGFGLEQELEQLSARFPSSPQVWELAEWVFADIEKSGSMQLSSLVRSKLEHGSRPGSSGAFITTPEHGTEILVAMTTPSSPLILKLEAEIGREEQDQLFGWGQELLRGGLALAKGVLEDLGDDGTVAHAGQLPELSLFPRSFRMMTTPLSLPEEPVQMSPLMEGELGSVPFAMLLALLSTLRKPRVGRRLLVLGRLGLRGNIDGVPDLEDTLLALHQHQLLWDHLVLARAGAFRLMRCPSWLWYERPLTLVGTARELLYWPKAPTLKGTRT